VQSKKSLEFAIGLAKFDRLDLSADLDASAYARGGVNRSGSFSLSLSLSRIIHENNAGM